MTQVQAGLRAQVQLLEEEKPSIRQGSAPGGFLLRPDCSGQGSKNEPPRFHTLSPETCEYSELKLCHVAPRTSIWDISRSLIESQEPLYKQSIFSGC